MVEWGNSLFKQTFGPDLDPEAPILNPEVTRFYQEAAGDRLENCELLIQSEDPEFLNIPWELIRDPTPGRGFLALSLAGFYRQHTGQKIETPPPTRRPDEPFRILLVVARPYGKKDVPLGTVARPMLEVLRPLKKQIQLEVLRPPTFQALTDKLLTKRGFYHLVHFDGHGVFVPGSGSTVSLTQYGGSGSMGYLAFEKDDGSQDIISSEDLGQLLATSNVLLFILNACQSAEEGRKDPFSSVASQLVATGAKGVVGMSYSIRATAASKFMEQFYKSLGEHKSLTEAVAAARRALYADPHRRSVIGPLVLRDWIIPILYQQEHRYIPIIESAEPTVEEPEVEKRPSVEERCPEGRFGFIGRDYDVLRLERALRSDRQPFALLTGIGGVGKTELAYGFARWFWETGGCPGGVFSTSFKEKASLGKVIGSIAGYGTPFSRLTEQEQSNRLIKVLKEHPCLIIWDNFETVKGYPEGATPLATEEEQRKLSDFLKALRGGKSRVIITTRKPSEDWLGVAYRRVELRGLTKWDAEQLAAEILKTVDRYPEQFKDDPDYSRLIHLLNGHPKSSEVALPLLRTKTPKQIIDALQHRVDHLGEAMEDASLSLAFMNLSERTRRHLPFIGLFVSYVHARFLGIFVGKGGTGGEVYEDVVKKSLDVQGWRDVLGEAERGGFIYSLGSNVYGLHPTLGPFLRRQLMVASGEEGVQRLDDEFMKFYVGWAASMFSDLRKADTQAARVVDFEEGNFLRALRLGVRKEEWSHAQAICQTLDEYYEIRGRLDEWRALRTDLLEGVGRQVSVDTDHDQADLWMFLLGIEANDALSRNDLKSAETSYREILDYLEALKNPDVDPKIAVAYHQLGMIAQERNRLDEAEEWYRKALEIFERLQPESLVVNTLGAFGVLRRRQRRFDEAVSLFGRALLIASEARMKITHGILVDLAAVMKDMGEKGFKAAWERAFRGEEAPIDLLRKILDESKEEGD